MSLSCYKSSTEHAEITFFKTLYHTSVKDLLEMDQARLKTFLTKTEAVCRWLEGIQKLADNLQKKGN